MATALDRDIRRLLDRAVRKARIVAEDGARKALTELGVEDGRRPTGLSQAQIDLRNRLRAHAKSLGDVRAPDDSIKANRLVREIAYEHWHRALFARFLAENNLLIDPDHKVAVSLSLLEQVANEEGRDLVELAAEWAEPMLPQIFRKDDPVLALELPPETKAGITEMVKGLPHAVFEADDSLGWVYQFWQADQKDRVNESEVKIGADELPAVTQLFTEDYMVLFLLENTLGAWWAGKALAADQALASGATSEEELCEKTSPPGYRWTYLRFVREPQEGETHETATGPWRPAAGEFEGWPKAAKEITVLDPCMGSGHFLVFALPILIAFRRAEEALDEHAAVKAVLAENLFGLEIDPRCTQIAAFALALASWKRLGGPEPLPRLNLACSGLAIGLGKAEFLKLAEKIASKRGWKPTPDLLGDGATPIESAAIKREREGLSRLYDLFEKAPYLGSLIDPQRTGGDLFAAGYENISEILTKVLQEEAQGFELHELAVTAQGLAKAAELLARQYVIVTTNVPFLSKGDYAGSVAAEMSRQFGDSCDGDYSIAFIDRYHLRRRCRTISLVCPQNWLSGNSYRAFRKRIIAEAKFCFLAKLGEEAFETFGNRGPHTILFCCSDTRTQNHCYWIDASSWPRSEVVTIARKPLLLSGRDKEASDRAFRYDESEAVKDRLTRIFRQVAHGEVELRKLTRSGEGSSTGDDARYCRRFWEVNVSGDWIVFNRPSSNTINADTSQLLHWQNGDGDLARSEGARIQSVELWQEVGLLVGRVRGISVNKFKGAFSKGGVAIVPNNTSDLAEIYRFIVSATYERALREIDPRVSVATSTLTDIKITLGKDAEPLPAPIIRPINVEFSGHLRDSASEYPLQVAVARLLG